MAPPDDDHDCGWKAYAAAQEQKLVDLTEKLAALERRLFEKKSERRPSSKLPPPLPKVKRTPEEARQTRNRNAALRDATVETEVTPVPVTDKDCHEFTVVIEFRAVFLATNELTDVIDTGQTLARHFTQKPLSEHVVRRLDICADVTNVDFSHADLKNFVGRSRRAVEYHAAQASARLTRKGPRHTGFSFSKGNPTMARLYNKTEELQCYAADDEKVLTELASLRYGGWDGISDAWRLELQLRRAPLQSIGVLRPEDIGARVDSIWQHHFVSGNGGTWLRLVDPTSATRRERCAVDRRWQEFGNARFLLAGAEPARRMIGRRRG